MPVESVGIGARREMSLSSGAAALPDATVSSEAAAFSQLGSLDLRMPPLPGGAVAGGGRRRRRHGLSLSGGLG
jgi:hypothetical protein